MTCQDCEIYFAQGEMSREVEEHLHQCAECRSLSQDLRANALALESLRNEELPRLAVKIPRRRKVYPWVAVAAAAAMFAFALLAPRPQPPKPAASAVVAQVVEEPAQPQVLPRARETAKTEPVRRPLQKTEPLKIKMLTSDPDVVIYWLIED
jgi:hypothetical protein